MNLIRKIKPAKLTGLLIMIAISSTLSMLLIFPLTYLTTWIIFDFRTANHYTLVVSIILSVISANAINYEELSNNTSSTDFKIRKSKQKEELDANSKVAFVLSILSLTMYFSLFSEFEIHMEKKEKNEMSVEERKRITLDIECRDIGYSYARAAAEGGRSITVPVKCRGRASTRRGIDLYYRH